MVLLQINIANAVVASVPDERFKRGHVLSITAAGGESLILQADGSADKSVWLAVLERVSRAAVFMQGPLGMQTGWRKKWKDRYFILSGSKLAWYESEANATAPGGSKSISSLLLAGTGSSGSSRITLNPPASYATGVEPVLFDRLILIQTGLDAAALAQTWPPVESVTVTSTTSAGSADTAAAPVAEGATAETEKAAEGKPAKESKSDKKEKKEPAPVLLGECMLVLAGSVEEAATWARVLSAASSNDACAATGAPTQLQMDGDEDGDADETPDGASADGGDGSGATSTSFSAFVGDAASSVEGSSAAATVAHSTTASNPPVHDGDDAGDVDGDGHGAAGKAVAAAQQHPVESEADRQQRLLDEMRVQAKALVAKQSGAAPQPQVEQASSHDTTTDTDPLPGQVTDNTPLQQQQQRAKSTAASSASTTGPVSFVPKVVMPGSSTSSSSSVGGVAATLSPGPKPPKASKPKGPSSNSTGADAPTTAASSSSSSLFTPASGEAVFESTLSVKEGRAKWGSGNSSNNVISGGDHGGAASAREDIEHQRQLQGDRSVYEGGGAGSRTGADRRFDDGTDDREGMAGSGLVKGVAGQLASKAGSSKNIDQAAGGTPARGRMPPATASSGATGVQAASAAAAGNASRSASVTSNARHAEMAAADAAGVTDASGTDDDAASSVSAHLHHHQQQQPPEGWTSASDGPERSMLRKRIFEYLLRRSSASSDPNQAVYLEGTLVPEVEQALYEQCGGDRAVYLDGSTLKGRLKVVFASRTTTGGSSSGKAGKADAAAAAQPLSPAAPSSSSSSSSSAVHNPSVVFSPEPASSSSSSLQSPLPAASTASTLALPATPGDHDDHDEGGSASVGHAAASTPTADVGAGTGLAFASPLPPAAPPIPTSAMPSASARAAAAANRRAAWGASSPPMSSPSSGNDNDNGRAGDATEGPSRGQQRQQQGGRGAAAVRSPSPAGSQSQLSVSESLAGTSNSVISSLPDSASAAAASAARRRRAAAGAVASPSGRSNNRSNAGAADQRPGRMANGQMRWGRVPHPGQLPIRHYPSTDPLGGVVVKMVLDRRSDEPPNLPTLNKWQHRSCASCGCEQTTGMFGVKATYCWYTELLFCPDCFNAPAGSANGGKAELRPLPWRIVHELDDTPYPVCHAATQYIDSVWEMPIVALSSVAPKTLGRSQTLKRIAGLRGRISETRERIVRVAAAVDAAGNPFTGAGGAADGGNNDDASDGGGGGGAQSTPAPAAVIARTSEAAAAALARCTSVLRSALGPSLAFMGEAPELLPLSLIIPAASPAAGGKITARLADAERVMASLLAEVEDKAGPAGGASEHRSYEDDEDEDVVDDERASPPRRFAGRTPGPGHRPGSHLHPHAHHSKHSMQEQQQHGDNDADDDVDAGDDDDGSGESEAGFIVRKPQQQQQASQRPQSSSSAMASPPPSSRSSGRQNQHRDHVAFDSPSGGSAVRSAGAAAAAAASPRSPRSRPQSAAASRTNAGNTAAERGDANGGSRSRQQTGTGSKRR